MKSFGERLVQSPPFEAMVMGNSAIVRGMVEAGTLVISSYPGSPTPEIAAAIGTIPADKRPFYFEFSVNEKTATEVAFGAALNGNLSTVFFKSVGLNVALDTFVQLGLMNIPGGMVVVIGDDPGANSSQNEQDNRNIFAMSRIPVLEPASPSEVYRYYLKAAKLAQSLQIAVVLRLTTHVCHGREKVTFGEYNGQPAPPTSCFSSQNGPYIPITSLALEMKRKAMEKIPKILEFYKKNTLNTVVSNATTGSDSNVSGSKNARGIITQGLTYLSVRDILHGTEQPPDILKLGAIYPLDFDLITDFLARHDTVLILEELDDIHEKQIKAMAFEQNLSTQIMGKTSDEDFIGEYTPDKVKEIIGRVWPDLLPQNQMDPTEASPQNQPKITVPERPAQMCPGCGHRSAFHAIKQALGNDDITVADIGCHTLGFMPPYEMGQVLLCMGASPGIASGLSLFNDGRNNGHVRPPDTTKHESMGTIKHKDFHIKPSIRSHKENSENSNTDHRDDVNHDEQPVTTKIETPAHSEIQIPQIKNRRLVAFLGDSTFFHAGLPGVINAIFNDHDITLIIMENGTTAMTGHQDHAGEAINIETLLKGMGIKHIFKCDTYQQKKLTEHVKEAMAIKGLSVVIASHPCMLKFTRAQKKRPGYVQKHVMIDTNTCNLAHTCVETFACPSFIRHPDGHITVNRDLCIGDGSCRQVCQAQAIIPEKETHT